MGAGGVFSCTVSRFDFGPLGPLEGALTIARRVSWSGTGLVNLVGSAKVDDVGVDERTVIGGAELWFLCSEFLLETGVDGGGDFRRGDVKPMEGVLSAFVIALEVDLGSLDTASVTGPGGSCGTLVADKAR